MPNTITTPKYELNFSNKYGDNWLHYSIYLGRRIGYVVEDFHCDRFEELHAYMQAAMATLPKLNRKIVTHELLKAKVKFGVGAKESKRRNEIRDKR